MRLQRFVKSPLPLDHNIAISNWPYSLNESVNKCVGEVPTFFRDNKQTDIWICPVVANSNFSEHINWLSKHEKEQAQRYRFRSDRERYIIAHLFLRTTISLYLGIHPSQLIFSFGKFGKPFINNCNSLHFNISKSDGYIILAINTIDCIGVDIEEINYNFDYSKITKEYFTSNEQEYISQFSKNRYPDQFFRLWTRKEAILKALGVGITHYLKHIEVLEDIIDVNNFPDFTNLEDKRYFISSFRLNSQHIISISGTTPPQSTQFFNFSPLSKALEIITL